MRVLFALVLLLSAVWVGVALSLMVQPQRGYVPVHRVPAPHLQINHPGVRYTS